MYKYCFLGAGIIHRRSALAPLPKPPTTLEILSIQQPNEKLGRCCFFHPLLFLLGPWEDLAKFRTEFHCLLKTLG